MRVLPAFVPVALLLRAAAADAGEPPTPAAMTAYAERLLDSQKIAPGGPGVTVLVARGEQLLYKGARGLASVELGVPLQPDQVMRIGSVTKQFAAAALLKQIDAGRARLDDPLSKFLPDYPNGHQITLLQLLNHTSGVKSYTGIPGYMDGPIRRDLTTAELIKEFRDQPVDFAPGQQWAYNNSGYVLLGAVVEAIGGKPWYQSIDDLLLAPAQIKTVAYPDPNVLVKGLAQGYTLNDKGDVAPAGLLSMTQPHAAGALVANTEGLWRWNQALHGGRLISAANYQRMITPEGVAQPHRYGFGIGTGLLRGQPVLTHGGGIHGFVSLLNYLPRTQTTVVILRNSDGPGFALDLVARKLAAFAIGEPFSDPQPMAVPVEQLQRLQGTYAREGQGPRTLRVKDGVLFSQRSGGSPVALMPLGGDRFAFPNSLAWLQIERGADGLPVALQLSNTGEDDTERWARSGGLPADQGAVALTPEQVQALVGDYASPQFSLRVFVDTDGKLKGQAPRQPAFELHASSARRVHVREVDATLEFSDEAGRPQSVTLVQGPNRIVMARK